MGFSKVMALAEL